MRQKPILLIMYCLVIWLLAASLFGCNVSSASEQNFDTSAENVTASQQVDKRADKQPISSENNRDLPFNSIPKDNVIASTDLYDLLENENAPFILDIRSASQYNEGSIENSKNIPAGRQIDLRLDEIPQDQMIVIISNSTDRLAEVRQTLIDAGFDGNDIYVVNDGIQAWEDAGYPLKQKEQLGC